MFSNTLIEMLKGSIGTANPHDDKEGYEALKRVEANLGWKFKCFEGGSNSGEGMVVSPCKRFILKHHYFGYRAVKNNAPKDAIPTHIVKGGGNGYAFTLQPRATITKASQNRAYDILSGRNENHVFDLKESNCGYFNRRPVLIDW